MNGQMNCLFQGFDKALADEIKAVESRGGNISLNLRDGKLIGELAGWGIYQFDVERTVPVIDESPALIEIRGSRYSASIINFQDYKLDIRILDFTENEIAYASLTIDSTFILKKLRDTLASLNSYGPRLTMPSKVFNLESPTISRDNALLTLFDESGNGPDAYQAEAIEKCLGSDVTFVDGPPGTGKTRTLVNLVNDLANRGKKVLITCHTNIACDNVLEIILRYMHELSIMNMLKNGEIVRIGTPVLQDQRIKELTIAAISKRLSDTYQEERDELLAEREFILQSEKDSSSQKQLLLERNDIGRKHSTCVERITAAEAAISEKDNSIASLNKSIGIYSQVLSIADSRGSITNILRRTNPNKLKRTISDLGTRKNGLLRDIIEEKKQLELLQNEKHKLEDYYAERFSNIPESLDVASLDEALYRANGSLEEIDIRIRDIDARLLSTNKNILDDARIIVSTLAKSFIDPELCEMQFDVVIVDEASIAPLPMLFYACSLARDKVCVFGDPKQLPPIATSDTEEVRKWLKRDIYGVASVTGGGLGDERVASLNNQYRMHEEIYNIINEYFYGGSLINKRVETSDGLEPLFPNQKHRVLVIDSTNANAVVASERRGPKSQSRYNLYHVQLIEKVLHDLIESGQAKETDMGVITPYRSQANFLMQMLLENEFTNIGLGTVHTFQGVERNTIILDMVEAIGKANIGKLLNDKHARYLEGDVNDAIRLLTVAFSRPKDNLIIIAHVKHMLENLPDDSILKKIITDIITRNASIDGAKIVPFYVPADFPNASLLSEEDLEECDAIFNQRSFYPHLIRDLEKATDEVIIISGYMTERRISMLLPYFNDLLSKEIRIRIFTKPPRETKSKEREMARLHHDLGAMGIEIYQHVGTHEKLVAIDRQVFYVGSLNVLSHNNRTNEMMIRIDSADRLKRVFSVLAKNYPKLSDYLIEEGYIPSEQITDLSPERYKSILEEIRPRKKDRPTNKDEAREYCRSMLKKLRWVIATDKQVPMFATLHNSTIEALLQHPPKNEEELLSLKEFRIKRSNIMGYESIVVDLLNEFRGLLN
jgi:hypothetical protein